MIMALPLRILTALRISIRQKLALAGIFCLGFVIIIFSIVRAVETSSSLTNSWSLKESDPVWLALWSILEASVAVCVSSLPTMRLFFTKTTPSSPGATPRGASNTIGSASSNPLRRIPAPLSSRRNSHARLPSTPPPNRDIIHQPHTATHNDDDTKKRPMSDGAATLTSNWTANISDEKATLAEKARVNSFFHPMSSPISPTSRAPNSPTKYSHREGARSPPGFSPIKGPSGGLEHTAVRELDVPRGSPGTLGMARESPFSSEDTKMERGEMVFEMGENTPPHRGGSIV
ncbi:MAG: hypothetical protein M1836_004336 [Candelina mexicana]|nr:MAG: hypothetical protein M1836_004336 [Candelina mexicana]